MIIFHGDQPQSVNQFKLLQLGFNLQFAFLSFYTFPFKLSLSQKKTISVVSCPNIIQNTVYLKLYVDFLLLIV